MNDWRPEEFTPTQIKENYDKQVFTVPPYQRALVWKDKQKGALIDSIKKGLPFGSLLLYRDEKNNKYQVIDGLQRSHTILEFVNNPAQFFDESDIDVGAIRKVVEAIGVNGNLIKLEESVKKLLREWVRKEHPTLDSVEKMQYINFGKKVANEYPTAKGHEMDIADYIEPMMDNYRAICSKINKIRIPAIVVTGDEELLPELFERINSQGTQLTKYQIFRATFSVNRFIVNAPELKVLYDYNRKYFEDAFDDNLWDDYDPSDFGNDQKLDAFQVAYGFGKYLCDTWPHLFGKTRNTSEVESVGFNLINICLGLKNKDGKKMHTALKENIGDDINEFLIKIIECVKFTDKVVGKYSKFKMNSRENAGKSPLHSEYQIVSMVASVFLLKYANVCLNDKDEVVSITYNFANANPMWKKALKKEFESNAGKIYIMEILDTKWVGGADKKMDQMLITPDAYTREIELEEFKACICDWFERLNTSRAEYQRVAAPKDEEILVLSAVYLSEFTASQQLDSSKYDIEHLATQKAMKARLKKYNGELRLPISSIGNLCLLPQYINRSKGEKTIYQDDNYLEKSGLTIGEIEDKYTFTTKEDLDWLNDLALDAEDFKSAYMNFLNKRFDIILSKIEAAFNWL